MSADPARTFRILRDDDDPIPVLAEGDQLLTVEEVARKLRVGRTTAYAMCKRGALPVVKFAGTPLVRVSARALDALITRQTILPSADRSARGVD